jgi:uncharacterized membrane protein
MESVIVLVSLIFLGVILIFPIWMIAVLYQIKNSQEKMNSEFREFMHIEREKRREAPKEFILKETHKPAPAPAPVSAGIPSAAPQPAAPREKKMESNTAAAKPWTAPPPSQASEFESNAQEIIGKIWSWVVVGEEHRPKNVSFEYAASSVWLLRSAILILLTGIGFFLKYSIENNLIGPYARIAISITAGLAMIICGIRLAGKKYHIIAQGLLGGGIATLYLSIFASYKIYKLIPDAKLSFAIMILITIATAIIAIRLNSMLVAIFGIIGGFCTPIMLSTGTADFPGLFSYMLILGIGVLAIAKYKDWKMLNALSFLFTYGLYLASLDKFYRHEDFTLAITFISLFFLLFSAIPILYNIAHREKSNALTLLGMFLNAAIFFSSCFHLITDQFERKWVAVLTLSLAAFYIIQILLFMNRKISDRKLLIMLTGFASFFITMTIPLVLSDEWITTAWSIQAVIFLWMSCRMKSNFIRMISYLLYFLAAAHLFLFDFQKNFIFVKNLDYGNEMLTRFMTLGILVISMAAGYRLMKMAKPESGMITSENDTAALIPQNAVAAMFAIFSIALLFIYLSLELNIFLNYKAPLFRAGGISILWGLFGFSFVLAGIIKSIKGLRYVGLILFTVVVLKVFLSDLSNLSQLYRIIAFLGLGLVVLAGAFIYVRFKDFFNTETPSSVN